MSNVFTRRREKLLALKSLRSGGPRSAPAPACPACGAEVPRGELHKNLYVCPRCGHHHASAPTTGSASSWTRAPSGNWMSVWPPPTLWPSPATPGSWPTRAGAPA